MCLNAGGMGRQDAESETLIPTFGGGFDVAHSLRGEGFDASEDGTGRGTPLVPVAFDTVATLDARAHACGFPGTDGACGGHGVPVSYAIQAGALRTNPASGPDGVGVQADHAYTLEARAEVQAVAFQSSQSGVRTGETHATLDANNGSRRHNGVAQGMAVRRLTPRECSRLQGFPDDYLELKYADADEAHATQVLHELWREAGTPALEEQGWRTGIVAALLTPEILLAGVHVGWLSWEVAARCAAARGALPGEEHNQEGFVRALRLAGEAGRSPFGRESFEQLARELGSDLSALPLEGAQAGAVLRGSRLWPEAQAKWPLRYALATGKAREKPDRLNPDGPRYKALGNSWAVPCVRWIGRRIFAELHKDDGL